MKLFFLVAGLATVANAADLNALRKGQDLLASKKYAEAEAKFLEVIRQKPSLLDAYLGYARAAVLLGDRKGALVKLEQASKVTARKEDRVKLAEERANLSEVFFTNQTFQLYQNGLNFIRLERPAAAAESLEKALKTEPDNVAILTAYGESLAKDNPTAAAKAFEQALDLNPDKREARLGLAEVMGPKDPKRLLSLVEPLALENDATERAALLYAKALAQADREKEAYEYLRVRAERNSDWVESLLWLGRSYAQSKEGAWPARKYLMMFLKREREHPLPTVLREEAQTLLTRVNDSLQ